MRIDKEKTIALVVDVQEKLFPHIYKNEEKLQRMKILIKGLNILKVPIVLNEQYKR
ncbi:MAG: hydrolase, partial [Campylobacteraceae bacterium]|nr:hydrolase [Campylobacteraceae bacterium]